MNNQKPIMPSRRKTQHVPNQRHAVTHNSESSNATQQTTYIENNSLLFTQILSGLVWNG